ncbi:hypothetical protein ACIGDI_35980 [Streptomyces sp. NPDC085900]|uniref:hypothetical protein n=1 Tax=Streptomyces sp. NPDC085900 TaxID=3365737 RepID=UPI0037D54E2A
MVLPSWKNDKSGRPRRLSKAQSAKPMPAVPVTQPNPWRTVYAERDPIPDTAVTRQLAASVHDRPHRLKQLKAFLGRMQDRALGRPKRAIPQLSQFAGEQLARWALREVLFADKRPVPSFGYELAPVLSHCVAARRQWRVRATVLVAVVVLTGFRYPFGVGTIAVLGLLHIWLRGGKLMRILKWGTTSVVSFILLGGALFGLYKLAGAHAPLFRDAVRQGERAMVLLALAITLVHVLDRWLAWGYVLAVRPGREEIGDQPYAAPLSARRIRGIEVTETWQTIAYQREYRRDRFVGAGPLLFEKGSSRIQLKAAGAEVGENGEKRQHHELEGLREFEADELMDHLRDELEQLREVLIETHSLPNCDVSEMLAVPEEQWAKLPFAGAGQWPEADEMIRGARGAPTSAVARRYLCAQVVSWDGQIVVTVLAHAALEGRTLHFVTRPHVMTPLRKETAVAASTGWALARDLLAAPLHAVGDTVDLAHRVYQVVRRSLRQSGNDDHWAVSPVTVGDQYEKPVSLREYCSRMSVEDMHQWEDVLRHVSILQTWMFARVRVFLKKHGADLAEFDKQVSNVINQTITIGNNNNVMTAAAGEKTGQTASGKASTETKE